MVTAAPSTTFEATATFASGLAGTLGVRIRDNAGADFLARTTVGIAADLTVGSTSVYRREFTAPSTTGQWTIVWDDTTNLYTEELVVSRSAPATLNAGPNYLTVAELKGTLALTGQVFADDDLELAISAACRAIDEACGRRFYPVDETRYFTPNYMSGATSIPTGDLVSVTALTVDNDGDGSYETAWTEGTHYTLEPFQNAYVDKPFNRITLFGYPYSLYRFPYSARSVKVEGTFNWATTPEQVKSFASIIAAKLVARMREREARLGFAQIGGDDAPSAIRLARTDPDFEFYLGPFTDTGPLIS